MGLLGAFAGGVALAILYLTLLWITVRRLPQLQYKGLWLAGTAVARLAALMLAFYWIMDGQWQRLLACLVGFILARLAVTAWVRTGGPRQALRSEDA
jgi:F1F0 ATPase subunit 2